MGLLNDSEADYIHLDIMDGQFVPNISFGFPVTQAVHQLAKKPLDFHLMIVQPEQYLDQCVDSGAHIITVHLEACLHLHRTLELIRQKGARAGVALNPHTPVENLADVLSYVDVALIMSVNPGFGGQKFIPETIDRIRKLRQIIEQQHASTQIEVDGGITTQHGEALERAGAHIIVAGSHVFNAEDPVETISKLKSSTFQKT